MRKYMHVTPVDVQLKALMPTIMTDIRGVKELHICQ
jgi:hypothetical protein